MDWLGVLIGLRIRTMRAGDISPVRQKVLLAHNGRCAPVCVKTDLCMRMTPEKMRVLRNMIAEFQTEYKQMLQEGVCNKTASSEVGMKLITAAGEYLQSVRGKYPRPLGYCVKCKSDTCQTFAIPEERGPDVHEWHCVVNVYAPWV
jgi:hypothetical protein